MLKGAGIIYIPMIGRGVVIRKPADAKTKVYFEVPANMLPGKKATSYNDKLAAAKYLQDPFGNPYHYEFPGKDDRSGANFYDLWSQGKKNSTVETTWIKNW